MQQGVVPPFRPCMCQFRKQVHALTEADDRPVQYVLLMPPLTAFSLNMVQHKYYMSTVTNATKFNER